jgi:hypothetical protein
VELTAAEKMGPGVSDDVAVFISQGGSIVRCFIQVMTNICETAHWSQQAEDVSECPPFAVRLVKLTIAERDGTVGSALSFIEDGLMCEQIILREQTLGASLQERRKKDGRWVTDPPGI